jgi:hypothetical protein
MEMVTVPVIFGLVYDSAEYLQARRNFPNAAEAIRAGCVVGLGSNSDQENRVWACLACTVAWEAWMKGQGT